jgi:hypothetical protein
MYAYAYPPNLTDQECSGQIEGRTMKNATNSSPIAQTTLVPGPTGTSGEPTPGPSGEDIPPTPEQAVVSPTREPTPDYMATVKQAYRAAGLCEQATVPEFVIGLNGAGKEVMHDPYTAPLPVVSEFLAALHTAGRQTNTLAGYRTAIGSIHKGFEDGFFVSNNPTLHRVIRGAFTIRPPPKWLVPNGA